MAYSGRLSTATREEGRCMAVMGEKLAAAVPRLSVVVVGRNSLQNRLVAGLIGERLG